jgi:hypothetical protein
MEEEQEMELEALRAIYMDDLNGLFIFTLLFTIPRKSRNPKRIFYHTPPKPRRR